MFLIFGQTIVSTLRQMVALLNFISVSFMPNNQGTECKFISLQFNSICFLFKNLSKYLILKSDMLWINKKNH